MTERITEELQNLAKATADLAGRNGSKRFDFGWTCDHLEADEEIDGDHIEVCESVRWTAHFEFFDGRLRSSDPSPTKALMRLCKLSIDGGTCRCGRRLTTRFADQDQCRWRLDVDKWIPGCDAKSIRVPSRRGDHEAMGLAWALQHGTGDDNG